MSQVDRVVDRLTEVSPRVLASLRRQYRNDIGVDYEFTLLGRSYWWRHCGQRRMKVHLMQWRHEPRLVQDGFEVPVKPYDTRTLFICVHCGDNRPGLWSALRHQF